MKILASATSQESVLLLQHLLNDWGHQVYPECNAASLNGEADLEVVWLDAPLEEVEAHIAKRRREAASRVSILTVCSWANSADIERILAAGSDDCLLAPFSSEELAVRLQVLQSRSRLVPDCEDRRLIEERLTQSQKVDTLTTLAGTLAHDFNNILAAILGNAELALLDPATNQPTRYSLEQIDKAARRAAEITRQMLTYSGRPQATFRLLNINELVEDMAELLRVSISKRCKINFHFTRPLPGIVGDPCRLRQVVMNLLLNASEAIGNKTGSIKIRSGLVHKESSDPWVSLEIEDSGSGMSPEILERIFDPFYTTKRTGRGLGLAAVNEIVRSHKGEVHVDSNPGRGTCFQLMFPVAAECAAFVDCPTSELTDWHGNGTILLIDDEELVRDAARRLLEEAGFTVYESASGDDGAENFCRHAKELNAVILDLCMPGLDAIDVYDVIRQVRPEMKVIVWSGFDQETVRERLAGREDLQVLEKPTSARELAVALKRVLNPECDRRKKKSVRLPDSAG